MRWNNGRPGMWYGYTDLGPIRIPVLPQYMALTDRADGTVWYLQHTLTPPASDGYGYISISDQQPAGRDVVVYAAYEGPIVGTNPNLRLLIRGGRLGYEVFVEEPNPNNVQGANQPVLTRRGGVEETRQIYKPSWWTPNHIKSLTAMTDELVWTVLNI